jgi:hypothetical protein
MEYVMDGAKSCWISILQFISGHAVPLQLVPTGYIHIHSRIEVLHT